MTLEGKQILVVEDDVFVREMVELALLREGARVYTAGDGQEGLRKFFEHQPALVILDIMMPHTTGWDMLRQIRQLADTPVILLTAVTHEDAVVRGLDMGAVDYVTKPFSVKVLVARARAALRPGAQPPETSGPIIYEDNRLSINVANRQVSVNGEDVQLTNTEFRLLTVLLKQPGRLATFDQILDDVWGAGYEDSVEYVHVYISRLRKKIEVDPKQPAYIINVPHVGYYFQVAGPSSPQ